MRGQSDAQADLFHIFDLESLVPDDHPLRAIKQLADAQLQRMSPAFAKAYSRTGRPSIPPEQLLKALLLQALYSVRSERQLCEQIGYNLLYRWFLGLSPSGTAWAPTTFTKNRDRFAAHGLLQRFFEGSVTQALQADDIDPEHFSVDGSLIQSWASLKSVQPRDAAHDDNDSNRWGGFSGQRRSNATHASTTDPEARLARPKDGTGAQLSHSVHVLMENGLGLCMGVSVAAATGHAERDEALALHRRFRRCHGFLPVTTAMDKGYDAGPFLLDMEQQLHVVPQVAVRDRPIKARDAAGDACRRAKRRQQTQRYRRSQRDRKRVEAVIGWLKCVGGLRRTRFIERWKTQLYAWMAGAAYNFVRLARLRPA
jgi:transposase